MAKRVRRDRFCFKRTQVIRRGPNTIDSRQFRRWHQRTYSVYDPALDFRYLDRIIGNMALYIGPLLVRINRTAFLI